LCKQIRKPENRYEAASTLLGSERPFGRVDLLYQIFCLEEEDGSDRDADQQLEDEDSEAEQQEESEDTSEEEGEAGEEEEEEGEEEEGEEEEEKEEGGAGGKDVNEKEQI